MKKFAKIMASACLAAALCITIDIETEAALNCTYEIIYDANGNIANGKEMLGHAKDNLAASQAYYNALKKSGTASELELQQAADAVTNATNVVRWWTDQVNNSNGYLKNIKDREVFEDNFISNRAALADLTTLQQARTDADNALEIANATLTRIGEVEKQIKDYTLQLGAHPEYQASIDELNKTLITLKKEYDSKKKNADDKEALFQYYAKTLNYAAYDKSIEDYAYNREINRANANWKP